MLNRFCVGCWRELVKGELNENDIVFSEKGEHCHRCGRVTKVLVNSGNKKSLRDSFTAINGKK